MQEIGGGHRFGDVGDLVHARKAAVVAFHLRLPRERRHMTARGGPLTQRNHADTLHDSPGGGHVGVGAGIDRDPGRDHDRVRG
ncbi:Uncharacterised protein [Mycobacteroides abscessus subsp. massiliense]|nr:Uncharacterised protein [Mycobacteroides abscessus subsp. massiliense]